MQYLEVRLRKARRFSSLTLAVTIEHETVERCALPDVLPEAQPEGKGENTLAVCQGDVH
jgi:hypothetical protein